MPRECALYVVATPIGNLGDITLRAIETLKEADVIAAEDMRVTRKILSHIGVSKQLISYREHNEEKQAKTIISLIRQGKNVALVSDAGTPGISDPGFRVVKQAQEEGVRVVSIPGPSALIASLSISGLPTDSFLFLGFPPRKAGQKKNFFRMVEAYEYTVIVYESPFRVKNTLEVIRETLGERRVFVARELTKKFEETFYGTAAEAVSWIGGKDAIKGEFVILIGKNNL
ncbi:MAG: 16S rRNA (cytidine(1402)-2'-O)-methyltransferase [Candidatus Niyogibacteria bacterium CG10_big_fil_rev_8_21_14_0_10_46_36]|uniref:Ribosomal RNA small subunit methyltransferase I n=1 Tax=Candidatus Niyogibacteria bacterium CG10_big_fil_rev_8_21_14_0_10_46_36 TaxID=1974726 RepID=A0A2H0TCN7_9BACT|nr:MAG: 16S rRNA (cytidine(1402)-2'-O)-methyltransferase [Candidatus Niyogibacteria bacterium CG10_big_fil_rev_8_21_14_0_10_46_36]